MSQKHDATNAAAASAGAQSPDERPTVAHSTDHATDETAPHASTHPSAETINRYLSDLHTISGLMRRYDERSIVGHWAYIVWGALVFIGTAINWRWDGALRTAQLHPLVAIWLPILIVGSAIEVFAILGKTRAEGISLFTRRMKRFVATSLGIVIVLALVIVHLDRTGFTAGILIALGATPLLFYAQETYAELFLEAFILVAAGLIVTILDLNSFTLRGAAGIAVGIMYIVSGFHSVSCERRARRARRDDPDRTTTPKPDGAEGS